MNCDSFLGNTIVPINPSISPAEMWTLAELGEFLLARRADITRLWIAAVDRSPEITSSNDLTYKQLLDHLVTMHDQYMTEMGRQAKHSHEQQHRA